VQHLINGQIEKIISTARAVQYWLKAQDLKRGWRATTNAAALSTKISNDVPYAKVHNEGGEIQHPARQQVLHFKKSGNITNFQKKNMQRMHKKLVLVRIL
jgi:hypothetical protein